MTDQGSFDVHGLGTPPPSEEGRSTFQQDEEDHDQQATHDNESENDHDLKADADDDDEADRTSARPPPLDSKSKLRADVEEFVDLAIQIAEANKHLKGIRSRKKELQEGICAFMDENGIAEIKDAASGEKIKLAKGKKLSKVDRQYLEESLAAQVGRERAEQLVATAYESRVSEETSSVRLMKK